MSNLYVDPYLNCYKHAGCLSIPCFLYHTQGLGFLNAIKDMWSEHDAKYSGQIKEELWKWLQLLLELIDVTLGQAVKQLEIIIRGKGVAKEYSKNINKKVSFLLFCCC